MCFIFCIALFEEMEAQDSQLVKRISALLEKDGRSIGVGLEEGYSPKTSERQNLFAILHSRQLCCVFEEAP